MIFAKDVESSGSAGLFFQPGVSMTSAKWWMMKFLTETSRSEDFVWRAAKKILMELFTPIAEVIIWMKNWKYKLPQPENSEIHHDFSKVSFCLLLTIFVLSFVRISRSIPCVQTVPVSLGSPPVNYKIKRQLLKCFVTFLITFQLYKRQLLKCFATFY